MRIATELRLGFSLAWVIYTSLHRMTGAHSSGLGSQRMAVQIALGNPLFYVFAVFCIFVDVMMQLLLTPMR